MDHEINYGNDYAYLPVTSIFSGRGMEVAPDLYMKTIQIVNVVFYGQPNSGKFVLIDTGMPGTANEIIGQAVERFGKHARPQAIILTHGHFDHVGTVINLVKHWQVPVYAHPLEIPYLCGMKNYEAPNTSAGPGLITKMSAMFPTEAINLGNHVQPLPDHGMVPFMPDFHWVHTPGHTPGHISLFRDEDGILLAGDAIVGVKQESLYKVLMQKKEVSSPPRYFTTDWKAALASVKKLAALQPTRTITGHGPLIPSDAFNEGLPELLEEMERLVEQGDQRLN